MNYRITVASLLLLGLPAAGWSQTAPEYVPVETELGDEVLDGWYGTLNITSTLSLSTSEKVVGQPDGNTFTFGLGLGATADYIRGPHELRNTLNIGETFSRTPLVDTFVKSADSLSLEDIYFYRVPNVEWFGPFGRLRWDTALFKGYNVQADPVLYRIANVDGTFTDVTTSRLELTGAFSPFVMRQSAGLFLRPIAETWMDIDFRAGIGAREFFGKNDLVLTDDPLTTDAIEVTELQNYQQAGAEMSLNIRGSFEEGKVSYTASGETMSPFANSLNPGNENAVELTNIEVNVGVAFKLVEWASLNYAFRAVREPLTLDEWQIANSLLLSLTASRSYAPSAQPEEPAAVEPVVEEPEAVEPPPAPVPTPEPPVEEAPAPAEVEAPPVAPEVPEAPEGSGI
jgi:hypothetical protein